MNLHTWADLQAVPPKRMWQMLRTMRQSPPGRATRGNRKDTFNAAMEQAEQLFRAAESIGTAARPLLTFYGVSQLGRAIAAASTRLDNNDSRLSGHGLKDGPLTDAMTKGLAQVTIRGEGAGAFPVVAKTLGASALAADLPLGDVCGLIPDAERFPLAGAGNKVALTLERESSHTMRTADWAIVYISPLPLNLLVGWSPNADPTDAIQRSYNDASVVAEERAHMKASLANYPTLSDFDFLHYLEPGKPVGFTFVDGGSGLRAPVRLPMDPKEQETTEIQRRAPAFHGVHRAYPYLDTSGLPAHPFLLWWAVLYVLSRLARYEPRDWVRLIAVSSSPDAVAIEYLLDEAQSALPELAYQAIEFAAAQVTTHTGDDSP